MRYAAESPARLGLRHIRHGAQREGARRFRTIATAIRRHAQAALSTIHCRLLAWPRPPTRACIGGAIGDLTRTKAALVAENAFLRQQLVVLSRRVKRPMPTPADRLRLVLLARLVRGWRAALLIVQPDTLLRWHRQGFRLVWRVRSAGASQRPQVSAETVATIQRLTAEHRRWGAERIRGELRKRGIHVGKRTVQRHMRAGRPLRPGGGEQTWATFLRNHAHGTWAGDFLPVVDRGFRTLFAFFVVERGSRRVVHLGVTRHPTDAWVAQQLREATPFDQRPRYLIRDNDGQYGPTFAGVAAGSQIAVLRTPVRAPRANATCERFLGSVRRACLDHVLVLGEGHRRRVLREYAGYCNRNRPHQGIGQAVPSVPKPASPARPAAPSVALPVLGGLHHDYRRAA
jgi:putative transposase